MAAIERLLDTPKLGYGTWALGGAFGPVSPSVGVRSLLAYLDRGGAVIDTARDYGDAERRVGEALRRWSGEPPFVATKVQSHGPRSRWGRPEPVDIVFPPGSVRSSVEDSLRALRLARVDLVQLHLYWPTWGVAGYWIDELVELRDRELVGAVGVSLPDYRHDAGLPLILADEIASVQTVVNLFDPLALDCLVPIAAERGVAVLARGVLDEGGLAGAVEWAPAPVSGDIRHAFFAQVRREDYLARLEPLKAFIPEHASSLAALALKFVVEQPGVTVAIVSMPHEDLVHANFEAVAEDPLPEAVRAMLGTRHRWVRNFFEPLYWNE